MLLFEEQPPCLAGAGEPSPFRGVRTPPPVALGTGRIHLPPVAGGGRPRGHFFGLDVGVGVGVGGAGVGVETAIVKAEYEFIRSS